MEKSLDVSIVGAGIGGLTAALTLKKSGHNPTIYEKSELLSELGAGVQLSPNANRVFKYLGIMEDLKKEIFEPEAFQFLNYRTGRVLAEHSLKELSTKTYGFPNYDIHRADLQKVLLSAIEKAEIKLVKDFEITDVGKEKEKPYIKANEKKIISDVVIGADGIHSVIRKKLWGKDQARYTKNVAWRMLVPIEKISSNFLKPNTTVWLGPKKHFVQYFVKGGSYLNCVCLVEQDDWRSEDWSEKGDIFELKDLFSGWHPEIQEIIESTEPDSLFKWGLHDRPPMKKWRRGKFSLLGDAAHPMLPFVAQGAAMAIEDGAVLADCISSYEDNEKSLKYFEQIRKPRTSFVQLAARRNAKILHLSGLAAFFRNIVMGYAGNKIFNKLYSYDALSAVNSKEI